MATIRSYQDLVVWQKAMELVLAVYKASKSFPRDELFGLTSQLRRAAVSVPSNIAEGQARRSTKDFLYFLSIARGSLQEVETQILIAERLTYIDQDVRRLTVDLVAEVGRLLSGLAGALERRK